MSNRFERQFAKLSTNKADKQRRPDKLQRALQTLERFAFIQEPEDCEEPILAPGPRKALWEWLKEIRNADKLDDVGIKPRRTCLLFGPPGTGKTTFAHHFAARLGLPLINIKSESIIDCWLGSTGRNIGTLFDALGDCVDEKGVAQVVVLFDEIDALGSKRTSGTGADNERANSLNVMLRRIEKFSGIAFGATNRHDSLDPALWRRFGMQICIDVPGPEERFQILKRYASPFDLGDFELDNLVELTANCSPSLLRQLMEGMKRTLILADANSKEAVDPVAAFKTIVHGIAPPPELTPVPALWHPTDGLKLTEKLKKMPWPPARIAKDEDEEAA